MDALTIVYPYYREAELLAFHCGAWHGYDDETKQRLRIIIVDDGSPDAPALPILRGMHLGIDLQLYRVNDDLGWHIGGAKNLGMHHVQTKWAFLSDIDHLLPEAGVRTILSKEVLDERKVYLLARALHDGRRRRPHPETFVLTKALYWNMGGYDEDFCSMSGCGCINAVIDRETDGREVLRDVRTLPIRGILPDPNRDARKQERRSGAMRSAAVRAKKASGDLPSGPHDHLRFEWERLL